MTITEMLNKVQYVTDTEGTRQAVIVDLAIWEELIEHLRDIGNEARWDELFNQHPEVLERLAEEARADRAAGRAREFDPDQLWNPPSTIDFSSCLPNYQTGNNKKAAPEWSGHTLSFYFIG